MKMENPQPIPQTLSPSSSGRRSSCDTESPEFEFWMVRNQSNFTQPNNLLSADELFSDGFLLPLHLLPPPPPPPPPAATPEDPEEHGSGQAPDPECSAINESSKRWRYIFKRVDKKKLDSSVNNNNGDDRSLKEDLISVVKEKKREKKINNNNNNVVVSAAELNIINIWPFSRSRSAGTAGNRPRAAAGGRKVSSAPCSRSNSTGESKSKKWPPPNSPSRGAGVHLGRTSPVWLVRRGGAAVGGGRSSEAIGRNFEKGGKTDGNEGRRKISPAAVAAARGGGPMKARVLSLNVPMCIGYRHNLSCRSDENSAVGIAAAVATGGGRGRDGGGGVRRSNLFNIRSLFSKKVY